MTKAKLHRLIKLSNCTALYRSSDEALELRALEAEFAAWEPEAEPPKRPDRNVNFRELARIGKDY